MAIPLSAALGVGSMMLNTMNAFGNQAQQQDNFDRQMAFAKYQYEDQKKYNSMVSQVARMRAAGINPALAIGGGQLGSVSGSVSQPSAPTPVSLGVGESLTGVGNLLSAESQAAVNQEDALGRSIDNDTRRIKNLFDLSKLIKELDQMGVNTSILKEKLKQATFDTAHQGEQFDATVAQTRAQTDWLKSQMENNKELLNQLKFKTANQQEEFEKNMRLLDEKAFNAHWTAIAAGQSAQAALKSAEAAYYDSRKILGIPESELSDEEFGRIVTMKMDELATKGYLPETVSSSGSTGFKAGSSVYGSIGSNGSHSESKTTQKKVYGTLPGVKRERGRRRK